MSEPNTENLNLIAERDSLNQDLQHLEQTPGFNQLTDRQRQIIKQSLYVQQRADREGNQNRASQNHVATWYCHAAIANLEMEQGLDTVPPRLPPDFFKSDFQYVDNQSDLEKILDQRGFPLVVQISNSGDFNDPDITDKKHSFLVLGRDQNGQIIAWDKKGLRDTYRVTTLGKIYQEYHGDLGYFWGIRVLEKNP